MSEYVDFHYMPLEGKITGKQVLKQTEDAINDLGNKVYNLDIDESRIDEAIEKSEQAINTADSALSAVTTDRAVWKNNVAEMIATDIDLGVTAATRGKMVFNDGSGAFYGVRSEKSGDVDSDDTVFLNNGNVAERIQSMNIIAKGNNIIFVANIAELIDSDALIGNVYGTTGYYSANDGGAGLYSIRAKVPGDAEDGGSIIFLDNGNVAKLTTDGVVNVKQFGAVGDGVTDDTIAIQKCIDWCYSNSNAVCIPNGVFLISAELSHKTGDKWATFPQNGIKIFGVGTKNSIIKADSSFPSNSAMLFLDGNKNAETLAQNAVCQRFDYVSDICFEGNDVAEIGLKLRGVCNSVFSRINIKNIAGDSTTASILFDSVDGAVADADTSLTNSFYNVNIYKSNGYGVLAHTTRIASTLFSNCRIVGCSYDGAEIAYAGLTFIECSFGSNGTSAGGGFSSKKSTKGAINRGLSLFNCEFEANTNYEINIDEAHGFNINGALITPYIRASTNQTCISIGGTEADNGTISNIRVQGYSIPDARRIVCFDVQNGASDVAINAISFGNAVSWNDISKRYQIADYASYISIDGVYATKLSHRTGFMVTHTTNANPIANVTGNGTEYKIGSASKTIISNNGLLAKINNVPIVINGATMTVGSTSVDFIQAHTKVSGNGILPNTYVVARQGGTGGQGNYTINRSQTILTAQQAYVGNSFGFDDYSATFTATEAGLYDFQINLPLTGFVSANTYIEFYITINGVKKTIYSELLSISGSTFVKVFDVSTTVPLSKNDVVYMSFAVFGNSTNNVDIIRNDSTGQNMILEGRKVD